LGWQQHLHGVIQDYSFGGRDSLWLWSLEVTVAVAVDELFFVTLSFHRLLFLLNRDGVESGFRKFRPRYVILKSLSIKWREHIFVWDVILNSGPTSLPIFTIHIFNSLASVGKTWNVTVFPLSVTYPGVLQSGTQQLCLLLLLFGGFLTSIL
jgi:hypothetical protein